ncbi:hypothetical protein VTJ04DRAFT_6061 [Mycothermus thermophilus]|uniref:uncharacterized protein n=1 Tax=Humicola insolens TaxID=85995 RepID=UPI003741FC82
MTTWASTTTIWLRYQKEMGANGRQGVRKSFRLVAPMIGSWSDAVDIFVSAGLGSRVSWASSVDLPFPPAISLGGMLNGRASVEAADS